MSYEPKLKQINDNLYIYSILRDKYVKFSPEEFVRQWVVNLYIQKYNIPKSLISEEKKIQSSKKRYDLLIYNKQLKPVILVEVKAPDIKISESAVSQALGYAHKLGVRIIVVTNGKEFLAYDIEKEIFLEEPFSDIFFH